MPFATGKDLQIHYEVRGRGVPLLLLNHLGASRLGWCDTFLTALAEDFTLILPDQRGTGCSDKPDGPYTLSDMACDMVSLLTTLGRPRVHLLGLSMGGAVAQALALMAPERIDHLVLVATFCGPRHAVLRDPAVRQRVAHREGLPREERLRAMLPLYYSPAYVATHEAVLVALTERGMRDTPPHTLVRHTEAVQQFDSYDRLAAITQPTLVVHGTADLMIPCANAQVLAERLPHARVALLPEVGHIPVTEQPDGMAQLIREFCCPGVHP